MAKNESAQNMGGPSFNPGMDKSAEHNRSAGTPSKKLDPKSENLRKTEGNRENYGATDKSKKPN